MPEVQPIFAEQSSANRAEYKINRVYFYFLAIAQQHVRGAACLRGAEFCIPIKMFLQNIPFLCFCLFTPTSFVPETLDTYARKT